MTNSKFVNPHGLHSASQYVTARDMAILSVRLYNEHPSLHRILKTSSIRSGNRVLRSHNLLLEHFRGAIGMKTGFVCAAGLNMVGAAQRGRNRYLTVILGEKSSIDRAEKAALLLEQAFQGKYKKRVGKLRSYRPRSTRSSPVNMRPNVCGRSSKIREFQLVVPQKRPSFARRYKSPQRKYFLASLGDQTHPQGALIHAPRGRKYRSHILQPRIKVPTVAYNVGLGPDEGEIQIATASASSANLPVGAAQASLLARSQSQNSGLVAAANLAQTIAPIPRPRPNSPQVTSQNTQLNNPGSLYKGGGEISPRVATPQTTVPAQQSQNITVANSALSIPLPRPRPTLKPRLN